MKSTVALELRVVAEPQPDGVELPWTPDMAVIGAATQGDTVCVQGVPHMLRRIVRNSAVCKLISGPEFSVDMPYNVGAENFVEVPPQARDRRAEFQCVACAAEETLRRHAENQARVESEWCEVFDSELAP